MDINLSKETDETKVEDLEIKDAQLIFNTVWSTLIEELGEENLKFPKEILWLNGAPGAGKGTHTEFILKCRDMPGGSIVISDLLQSEEARKRKDAGLMVGDKEVTELLLKELLKPSYANGAIVDGFPRTKVQVECLKLFFDKVNELRSKSVKDKKGLFIAPRFHILVLFIDEAESVKRQLKRGRESQQHNDKVQAQGMGQSTEVRVTDLDEEAARNRYRTFKELTYDSLQSLRQVFHYHLINAHGSIPDIQEKIVSELKYQSSLELSQNTCDRLSPIPLANSIGKHARQQLVERLENYEANHTNLFKTIVDLIEEKFIPVIERHAITGVAHINTESSTLDDPLAQAILIDIFSERGYQAMVDVRKKEIPVSVDLQTGEIKRTKKSVYRVQVRFPGSNIRRGI